MHVSHEPPRQQSPQCAGALIKRLVLDLCSLVLSPLLFRLSVGRWPDRAEKRQFAAAFRDDGMHIPPLPRALVVIPAAREQIARMICLHLMAEGALPKPSIGGIPPLSGNPMHCWQGPAVSFLHFERTGGTSLAAALTDRFHPLQIAAAHRAEDIDQPRNALDSYKLIWGHYDLPTLLRVGPSRRIITILRDPAARILSLYYFWRSIHPSQLEQLSDSRVLETQKLSLLKFLHSDHQSLRDSIDNVYVRRITGLGGGATLHDPLEHNPEQALTSALEALQNFAYIGFCEAMPEAIRGIETILGEKLAGPRVVNDAAANPVNKPLHFRPVKREEITPAINGALLHLTRLDRVIYETARSRTQRGDTSSQGREPLGL